MQKISNLMMAAGGAVFGTSLLFNSCTYTVDAGERAIILDQIKGLREEIVGEGMHFYIPFFQKPVIFEIRVQPEKITSDSGSTKDLQKVGLILRVLHRPIPEYLPAIYNNIGKNYKDKILPSIGNEVLKSIVAQYDADQLLKKRETISNEIKDAITERARDYNIALDDVSIVHIGFERDYAQAIEQKQVAQQLAERQRFIVQRHEEEKNAQIILSEGEAESAKLINEAVKAFGQAQIEIKRLEAAKIIAEHLSKSPNVTFLPSGGNGLLLNLRA